MIPINIRRRFSSLPWGWITIASVVVAGVVMFVTSIMVTFQDNSVGSSGSEEVTGGRLSEATLAWQGDVEAELTKQGLDPNEWTIITLGIIQVESGGNADKTPDIMQASESKGLGMNTIDNPQDSIKAGVTALSNAISVAKQLGITDPKAILQAYNVNTGFLKAMKKEGKTTWDIDFSQEYSRNVVYPAVTGNPPSMATKQKYENPWSIAVGMPWYWYNGGNFHYPNIVYYYISGATGGAGNFDGSFAIPFAGNYVVTSEYGYRVHPNEGITKLHAGIDLVGQGDKNIRSIADGVVVQSTYNEGWGNYVVVDHGVVDNDRYYSLYAHLRSPGVKTGTKLSQGDIIGLEGSTGNSTGSHLHLEIIKATSDGGWSGVPRINPRNVISFK